MKSCSKTFFFAALIAIFAYSTASAQAVKHVITFKSFAYSPALLQNVHLGDTIEWIGDFGFHPLITTSFPANATEAASDQANPPSKYDYVVKVSGKYLYECANHGPKAGGNMAGEFDVNPAGVNLPTKATYSVEQNSPNPAMQMTHIGFTLAKPSQVAVRVFDEKGVVVREVEAKTFNAGRQMIMLDVSALTSGSYFYELVIDGTPMAQQMIVTH